MLGSAGSDLLFVSPAPTITPKRSWTTRWPLATRPRSSSPSPTPAQPRRRVAFTDFFATILPTASVTPAAACCGAGSSCTFFQLVKPMGNDVTPARLFVPGHLAPAGMAGDSCTFSLTLNVSSDAPVASVPNETLQVSATVDGTALAVVSPLTTEVVGGVRLVKQDSPMTCRVTQ